MNKQSRSRTVDKTPKTKIVKFANESQIARCAAKKRRTSSNNAAKSNAFDLSATTELKMGADQDKLSNKAMQ